MRRDTTMRTQRGRHRTNINLRAIPESLLELSASEEMQTSSGKRSGSLLFGCANSNPVTHFKPMRMPSDAEVPGHPGAYVSHILQCKFNKKLAARRAKKTTFLEM
jgi:hypothetical protein